MTTRRNPKSIKRNGSILESFFCSTGGKSHSRFIGNFLKIALPISLFFTFHSGPGFADPKGGVVTAGEGNISTPDVNTTQINQHSQNMVLNWESFNVDANEVVQFSQPNANAQALNRIFDQNPSQIFGTISANGKILLVNPNGVFINERAKVSVGSLIVSGLDISEPEFMAGKQKFINANGQEGGLIINQGLLEAATGGSVSLIGGAVKNEGVIFANAGQVNLVAGKAVTVDFEGDGLLQFTVSESILKNAHDLDNAVSNSGTIRADGGSILLEASAAKDVFTHVVNNSGVVGANKIENHGGVIKLVAGGTSNSLINMGTLDVSSNDGAAGSIEISATDKAEISRQSDIKATSSSGKGGVVHITGHRVGLFGTTRVDASGKTGGGEVLIGGDYQGKNPTIKNATETYIGSNVGIHADAVLEGDGGKIIVWADDTTRYFGSLSARGGSNQGDGGFAEVSGKENLLFRGKANLSAENGSRGTLLLDPKNIQIKDSPDCGSSCDVTSASSDNATTGAESFSNNSLVNSNQDFGIRTSDLVAALTSDVILKANNDITIDSAIDATGNNDGGSLELQAGRNIDINANISIEGSFTAIANEEGATAGQRDSGDATFNSNGFTIDTSDASGASHNISIKYQDGPNGNDGAGTMDIGTLNAGSSGTITINAKASSTEAVSVDAVTNSGALTITNSNGTTFEGAVTSGTITLTDTSNNQTIAFQGNVTASSIVTNTKNYDVSLTGGSNTFSAAQTFQNTGDLTLGNASGDTFTFNGGLTESSGGTVTLAGSINSSNDAISFGAVTLDANTTIDTNATNTTGDLTIGAVTGGSNTLTLTTENNIASADITASGNISDCVTNS